MGEFRQLLPERSLVPRHPVALTTSSASLLCGVELVALTVVQRTSTHYERERLASSDHVYVAHAQVRTWQILLQKYFGARPHEQAQKSIPPRPRSRSRIPTANSEEKRDSISRAIFLTTERLLQQNRHQAPVHCAAAVPSGL